MIKAASNMKQLQKIGAPLNRKAQQSVSGGINSFPLCGTRPCGICIFTADDSIYYTNCTGRCPTGYRFWCYFP
jgi:hypothetical protein